MTSSPTALIDQLRAIVGPKHVLNEGDLTAYEQDWRKRSRGKSLAVVRPANTQQVADVVKACAAAGASIAPQGGNTGYDLRTTRAARII
jgi:FAD/FMN-containing dehydrogenase